MTTSRERTKIPRKRKFDKKEERNFVLSPLFIPVAGNFSPLYYSINCEKCQIFTNREERQRREKSKNLEGNEIFESLLARLFP